jgi:hypothetical protein
MIDRLQTTRDPQHFSKFFYMNGKDQRDTRLWLTIYRGMPRGWFERNKVFYVENMRQLGLPRADASVGHINSEDWRRRCAQLLARTAKPGPYSFLAAPLSTIQPDLSMRFIKTEALLRLARTACALERYRLAHGQYPESLMSLAPQFIAVVPDDVIDGGELMYRRTDNDRFVLYSIGWNGKDDGGEIALTRNRWLNDKEGDWVWNYPRE